MLDVRWTAVGTYDLRITDVADIHSACDVSEDE